MKSAKSWVDTIRQAAQLYADDKLEEQIKLIQDDVLDFTSNLVLEYKWQKGSMNYNQGFISGKILTYKFKNSN